VVSTTTSNFVRTRRRAYTLLELLLVLGIVTVLAALAVPNFYRELERDMLSRSARQLRSLLTLVGANAAFDGKRYQIRFPMEGERDALDGTRQPIIEREDDPIYEPEVFIPVTVPWAVGNTLLGEVWCAEVRLGRPTAEKLRRLRQRSQVRAALEDAFDDYEFERPPLVFDPDGSTEWATFVLTEAPAGTALDALDDQPRIEVILEGRTGLAWLQRPFYEEEVDLFLERNWPVVLRQDFLEPRVLTEKDVLELRELGLKR